MSAFTNVALNEILKAGFFNQVRELLITCCGRMVAANIVVENNENKIRNELYEKYLKPAAEKTNDLFIFIEQSENYDEVTKCYVGRTDIIVRNINIFRNQAKYYYIIECKRIDNSMEFNKNYIKQGVARFLNISSKHPSAGIIYKSVFNRNFMLAFVVNFNFNPITNVAIINVLNQKYLGKSVTNNFQIITSCPIYVEYTSKHKIEENLEIELLHIFYDFSSII